MNQIDRLLTIMQRLRDPENGCPWDKEQTFATIAPYTLEETYEVLDAIAREDFDDLRGETRRSAVPGGVLRTNGPGRRAL